LNVIDPHFFSVLPLPIFHGVVIPPMPDMTLSAGGGVGGTAPGGPWAISDADFQKFNTIFTKIVNSPMIPVMDGDTAKEMFAKSGQPAKVLGQVW